jgi:hypothetical protein
MSTFTEPGKVAPDEDGKVYAVSGDFRTSSGEVYKAKPTTFRKALKRFADQHLKSENDSTFRSAARQ